TEYLRLFGLVALAYMWTRMARLALGRDGDGGFHKAKLGTARFFMHRLLPQTGALFATIMAGKGSTMDFDEAWF
ncbi:MAG: acyl-CoA dehydrogenase C-terminal domain-containing protein, partial [Rhodospirillales bacterium]